MHYELPIFFDDILRGRLVFITFTFSWRFRLHLVVPTY